MRNVPTETERVQRAYLQFNQTITKELSFPRKTSIETS